MVQICPRCQRANPAAAVFCHFDGCLLKQGAAPPGGALLQEFVFPSGRRCRTFDEIVQGCYGEWQEARQMLADGTFGRYLAGVGRADLAKAARDAAALPDRDIALTNFIASLPATAVQGPKLGLSPRKLLVGPLRVGEGKGALVKLTNEGMGLLQGNAHLVDADGWLSVIDGESPTAVSIKTAKEVVIQLKADTARLTVGQNYSAKLVIVTNGGVAEVPVRLDLVVRPFARAPFAGQTDARTMAKLMSKRPDEAVALLHNGEIERWFSSNGWTYPIAGTPAPGRAAVQQFFEELGLAKPPPVSITEQDLRFRCAPPEKVQGQVTLRTANRRIVYGRAESDSGWLRVTNQSVAGDFQASIGFEVDSGKMDEDRVYLGNLKVIANAGQTFNVRVQVDVQGNRRIKKADAQARHSPPPPAPVLVPAPPAPAAPGFDWGKVATQPAPPPRTPSPVTRQPPAAIQYTAPAPPRRQSAERGAGIGRMLLVGAIVGLLGRMALVFPADLFARLLGSGEPGAGALRAWLEAPPADGNFLKLFVLATWWIGALVGAILVWQGKGRITDLFCGLIAGAVLGLAGAATLGCLLVLGDGVPRLLLSAALHGQTWGPAIATPVWLITAVVCWVFIGAAVGAVLGVLGRRGAAVLAAAASPLRVTCGALGMGKAAGFFALR